MAMQDQTAKPTPRCPHCKEQCIYNVLDGQIPGDIFVIRQLFCSNKECHALLAVFPVAKVESSAAEPASGIVDPRGFRV